MVGFGGLKKTPKRFCCGCKQNADLQINNLNNNAQPFYVLVGEDERVLVSPYGYDKSVQSFVNFLDEGKKKYAELYSR